MPRLLIVKTSSLGDVIHNLPILADIRAHVPEMRFDWVVEEGFADIPALHPAVDNVIPVAIRRWRKKLLAKTTWHEIAALRQRLQQQPYDYILDTQGLLKSALLTRFAHGEIHGQDRASAREPLARLFYQHTHHVPRGQHAVTRNRQLAAQALGYSAPDTPADYGIQAPEADPLLRPSHPYVVGLHATSRDSKRWRDDYWITLGKSLATQGYDLLLPWGSPQEQQRAHDIAQAVPQAAVPPKLSLRQLAGLIGQAKAAVGVDTGLSHLAVALGIPTVALFTDTDPTRTGVFAGTSQATNLGGRGQMPTPEQVLAAISPAL